MKRRQFIQSASYTAAAMGMAPMLPFNFIDQLKIMSSTDKKEFFAHYVLFWLKEDLTEEETQNFTGFFEELRKVPNAKALYYGRSANSTPRDVVDNSFTYNLLIFFDTLEDLEIYGKHPIHMAAIDQYGKYWTKVAVHDSLLK